MRGTLGEYVAYKSYTVRKRERAPRPDTQNKIKMILIHILPPRPHSEKHSSLSLGARRQRLRAQWPAVRMHGGGRGVQRGRQEGRQKRRVGKKEEFWYHHRCSLSHESPAENQIAVQCSTRTPHHKRNCLPGIACPLESPVQSLYFQNQKGQVNHIESPPLPNQRNT